MNPQHQRKVPASRRILGLLVLASFALLSQGCQFLQNEFWVY